MTKKLTELLKKADLREMYLIQEVAKRCEGTERSFYERLYNQRKKEYEGKYKE